MEPQRQCTREEVEAYARANAGKMVTWHNPYAPGCPPKGPWKVVGFVVGAFWYVVVEQPNDPRPSWLSGVQFVVPHDPANRLSALHIDNLHLVEAPVDRARFPHVCPRCSAPAYLGFNSVDCSAGCK